MAIFFILICLIINYWKTLNRFDGFAFFINNSLSFFYTFQMAE